MYVHKYLKEIGQVLRYIQGRCWYRSFPYFFIFLNCFIKNKYCANFSTLFQEFFFSLGLIRMTSPATVMIPEGGNVSSSMMAPGPNSELQPRTPRPAPQSGKALQFFRIEEAGISCTDYYKIQLPLMRFLSAKLKCYLL